MKRTLQIIRTIFLIAVVIASVIFLTSSCKSPKVQNTHTIEKIVATHYDSVAILSKIEAINDSLFVKIGEIKTANPDCDSITNAEIKKLLQQVNSLKKSGNNELGFYYDEHNKMLVAYGKIAEQLNSNIQTNNVQTEKETDKEIVEIPVQYIPTFMKWLAGLGVAFFLFLVWRFSKIFQ
jgi:uncharacterized FlaG/YvyC family protein